MMSKRRQLAVTCALLLGLAGCETSPTSQAFERPIPSKRIIAPELLAVGDQQPTRARLLLKRDLGMQLGACGYEVFVNHKRVALLFSGEFLLLDLPPGQYGVHLQYGGIVCPSFSSAPLQVTAPAGATRVVRMGVRGMLGFIQQEEPPSPP